MNGKICPKCNKIYTEHSALSRNDNKTKICPECGRKEAINDYFRFLDIENIN